MSARKSRVLGTGRTNTPVHSAREGLPSVRTTRTASARSQSQHSGRAGRPDEITMPVVLEGLRPHTAADMRMASDSGSARRPQTVAPSTQLGGTGSTWLDSLPAGFWDTSTDMGYSYVVDKSMDKQDAWLAHYRAQRLAESQQGLSGRHNNKPTPSKNAPLRSLFLDPKANPLPKSVTHTELLGHIRARNCADESYDIDGDGFVDHEDMKTAKKMDVDGKGVLKPEEAILGKRMLAEKFFRSHKDHLQLFNPDFLKHAEKDNVYSLVTDSAFTELFAKIRRREQSLRNKGSAAMISCMSIPSNECTWNYYNDKYDATAWNNWDRVPRKAMGSVVNGHSGSREKLIQYRRLAMRDYCANRLGKLENPTDQYSTKRIELITNSKYYN